MNLPLSDQSHKPDKYSEYFCFLICQLKVRKFQNQIFLVLIWTKKPTKVFFDLTYFRGWGRIQEIISFVFWLKWEQEKLLSKLTDLYFFSWKTREFFNGTRAFLTLNLMQIRLQIKIFTTRTVLDRIFLLEVFYIMLFHNSFYLTLFFICKYRLLFYDLLTRQKKRNTKSSHE